MVLNSLAVPLLTGGLAFSLAGNVFLGVRSSHLDQRLSELKDSTQAQITQLNDATTTLLEQRLKALNRELEDAQTNSNSAIKAARQEARVQQVALRKSLQQQQEQVASDLSKVKEGADTKIAEVSTDVSSVKSTVNGVQQDVTGVKESVATTRTDLDKTSNDLKRAIGDMGVMSGLIATNSKDLDFLRQLGERNYIEFDLAKNQKQKKVGNLVLTLRNADPKRNRYTVQIVADDKTVEKKDRTINEPVQFYTAGNKQPYEIVINQVNKDQIVGYLATPKIVTASR
jgi:chromosome segregation ATPase